MRKCSVDTLKSDMSLNWSQDKIESLKKQEVIFFQQDSDSKAVVRTQKEITPIF